jgi:RNA polymerase sigma-70 factor (ECF subfamily)
MIDFDALYRAESRRVLATLIRLLGDFDLAEDGLHDAFMAAAQQWPRDGVPENARAWLVSTGRFSALARWRKRAREGRAREGLARELESQSARAEAIAPDDNLDLGAEALETDRLRLIFTCCHPSLGADAQLALTLREVCGLSTEQIAAAFLAKPATIAQRIVRTKRKISEARIPYEVPSAVELPERLELVLHVIYLLFNEGYAASSGPALTRPDLCAEAIQLCRSLLELLHEADVEGLLALLLLQDSRREARVSGGGDLILLADQDRSRWNRSQISEGLEYLRRAWARPPVSAYTVQAGIAAVHARAPSAAATDWAEIVRLYDLLIGADPSPVIQLNRAVALGELAGPQAGLAGIDALLGSGELAEYRLAHSARAEFLRRLGQTLEARAAYERALSLTVQEPERRFLVQRIADLRT